MYGRGSTGDDVKSLSSSDREMEVMAGTAAAAATASAAAGFGVASASVAVASATAASIPPPNPNESLYDALLRYHQENDCSASEGSSHQHQHAFMDDRPDLNRKVSCYGEHDDRKLPALPTPETKRPDVTLQNQQLAQDMDDSMFLSPLTAPSFVSIPGNNDNGKNGQSGTTVSEKDGATEPAAAAPVKGDNRKKPPPPSALHDDVMHSSFYLAALEEANMRGGSYQPNDGDIIVEDEHNNNSGIEGTSLTTNHPEVVAAAAATNDPMHSPPHPPSSSQEDGPLYKPYSPKAKKPGIVMVNEPGMRSDSAMYRAAYGNSSNGTADRDRSSGGSEDSAAPRTRRNSTNRRSVSSTDSMREAAAEAAAAMFMNNNDNQQQQQLPSPRRGSAGDMGRTYGSQNQDLHLDNDAHRPWPLSSGSDNINTAPTQIDAQYQRPERKPQQAQHVRSSSSGRLPKIPTEHPPIKHRSQPDNNVLSPKYIPTPMGPEEVRQTLSAMRQTKAANTHHVQQRVDPERQQPKHLPNQHYQLQHPHMSAPFHNSNVQHYPSSNQRHAMASNNVDLQVGEEQYAEYTMNLPPDPSPNHRPPTRNPGIPSLPPTSSIVRHPHRNMSPKRNPPTPNPMLPKSGNHSSHVRRGSNGSISAPPDLMDFGSDEHIRSTANRQSRSRQSGGGSRPSSRTSSPARGVSPSPGRLVQNNMILPPPSMQSSTPPNPVNAKGRRLSVGAPSPQPSPTAGQRLRPTYPTNSDISASLTAAAPWNKSPSGSYNRTSVSRQIPQQVVGTIGDLPLPIRPGTGETGRPSRPMRNMSNPDIMRSGRIRPTTTPSDLKRSNSSSFGSVHSGEDISTGGGNARFKSDDSTATDPDFKLALELSRREATSNRFNSITGRNTTTDGPSHQRQGSSDRLYPKADISTHGDDDDEKNNPLSSFARGNTSPKDMYRERSNLASSSSNQSPRRYPSNDSILDPPTQSQVSTSAYGRTTSPVRPAPSSHILSPHSSDRVGVREVTPGQFGQDAYRLAQETSEEEIDDLMLALKLSAEEASKQEGRGVVDGGMFNTNISNSTTAQSSSTATTAGGGGTVTPDEQYRILQRIQEEQERQQLEEALRASEQEVPPRRRTSTTTIRTSRASTSSSTSTSSGTTQRNISSSTTRRSREIVESTGGRGALTPHPVPDQERADLDFLTSQRLAMEEYRRSTATGGATNATGGGHHHQGGDPRRDHLLERGTRETQAAISAGEAHVVTCQGCGGRLQAPKSYSLVYCPNCKTISPA